MKGSLCLFVSTVCLKTVPSLTETVKAFRRFYIGKVVIAMNKNKT